MKPSSGRGHRCWRHTKCRRDNFHKARGRRQEENCPLERQSWGASTAFWHAWAFSTGDGRERCLKRWLSGCLNHSEPHGYLQTHTLRQQNILFTTVKIAMECCWDLLITRKLDYTWTNYQKWKQEVNYVRLYLLSPMRLSLSRDLAYSPWALGIVHPAQISCTTISNNALERVYSSSTHCTIFRQEYASSPLSNHTPSLFWCHAMLHWHFQGFTRQLHLKLFRARVTERLGLGWWQHLKCMARTQNDTNLVWKARLKRD